MALMRCYMTTAATLSWDKSGTEMRCFGVFSGVFRFQHRPDTELNNFQIRHLQHERYDV